MKQSKTLALIPLQERGVCESTHIKVEMYYTKGGYNYWSGGMISRGITLAVRPIKLEDGGWYTSESFTVGAGYQKHVLDMNRWNAKAFDRFIPSRELVDEMIAAVAARHNLKVPKTFIFMGEEVEVC